MMNLPSIGILPTSSMAVDAPLLNVGAPALIALGVAVAVVAGVFCVTRLRKTRRRPAVRSRPLPSPGVTVACAPEGGR